MTAEYTPEQRKEMADAFRLAGDRIWDGVTIGPHTRFICQILVDLEHVGAITGVARRRCRMVIEERLYDPCNERLYDPCNVELWLRARGYVNNIGPNTPYWPQIQAYRKRWCLALAEEFSA